MSKPHTYPDIPSLDAETQLYTQRRKTDEPPANFKFTVLQLAQFIIALINPNPAPQRFTFTKQSGTKVQVFLPVGISFPDESQIYVYVEGRGLIPWGEGLERQNNNFIFTWPLDQQTVEVVIYL